MLDNDHVSANLGDCGCVVGPSLTLGYLVPGLSGSSYICCSFQVICAPDNFPTSISVAK